jgi:hypothetical protein
MKKDFFMVDYLYVQHLTDAQIPFLIEETLIQALPREKLKFVVDNHR